MKLDSLGSVVFCCHKTNVLSNPRVKAFFVWILTACRNPGSFYYSISAYETLPALCARSPFILKTCQRCNTRGRSCERTKVFSCVILQLCRGFCHIKLWASLHPDLCTLALVHTPSHFKLKQKIWCIYRKTEKCCNQFQKTKQKKNNHDNKVGWVWVVVFKPRWFPKQVWDYWGGFKGHPKGTQVHSGQNVIRFHFV